jgi:hypothetical protein
MSNTEILEELPNLNGSSSSSQSSLSSSAAYAKNPDAGSTWEEVEGRIQARLSR